jgi:hypothetical protein
MVRFRLALIVPSALLFSLVACSSAGGGLPSGSSSSSNGSGGQAGSGGIPTTTGGQGGSIPGAGGGNGGTCVPGSADVDNDNDGWTENEGDCDDCDPNKNPGAIDLVNYVKDQNGKPTTKLEENQIDEDCDGKPAKPTDVTSCDSNLPIDVGDPLNGARAMGLCQMAEANPASKKDKHWGVLDARFSDISGPSFSSGSELKQSKLSMALNFGALPNFGAATQPREGSSIFALSSGESRAPGQSGFVDNVCNFDKGYTNSYPGTFHTQSSPGCGTPATPHDGVALEVRLRAPTNAKSFRFEFRFFTCEYPTYVCQKYNDIFAVMMDPYPLPQTDPMFPNVAFDTVGNDHYVIGVNNKNFLTACDPGPNGYNHCKGSSELKGSGFENHAASAWLVSQVPMPTFKPGEDRIITLRFAIWDSSDGILDSTAVVDNFQWDAEDGSFETVIVPDLPK